MSTVVYTATYGDYDYLKPSMDLGADTFCFTDDGGQRAGGWSTVVELRPESHSRMQAKWFKMHPHVLFPDYDVSIWIDVGWVFYNQNAVREMVGLLGDKPSIFFPHRWRKTVKAELQAHLEVAKYNDVPVEKQVASYFELGFPDNVGLMECTVLVRHHNHPETIKFNEAWWKECVDWTYADQLSCPYVAWKEKISPNWFEYNLSTQPWFRLMSWRGDK